MKKYLYPLLLAVIISCKPSYKKCICNSNNEELKAYSEILNELVEHRFYNLYLGPDEERVFKAYAGDRKNAEKIDREVIRLQNKIFNDTSRFSILYLDTSAFKKCTNGQILIPSNTSRYGGKLRTMIQQVSGDLKSVIDTFGNIQNNYLPQDFKLCTSTLRIYPDAILDTSKYVIGKVQLSRMLMNPSKNKAFLYIDFVCGGNCGFKMYLLIEKMNGKWELGETYRISVS